MAKPKNIDEYLANVPERHRAALERVRKGVHAAAPGAVETISYEMAAFKAGGRNLLYMAAFSEHCSIYPFSDGMWKALGKELTPYATYNGKGTLRFSPAKGLPATLVRKIVKARMAEDAAAAARRVPKKAAPLKKSSATKKRAASRR